jgi:hypothetical protein
VCRGEQPGSAPGRLRRRRERRPDSFATAPRSTSSWRYTSVSSRRPPIHDRNPRAVSRDGSGVSLAPSTTISPPRRVRGHCRRNTARPSAPTVTGVTQLQRSITALSCADSPLKYTGEATSTPVARSSAAYTRSMSS